jgi:hypothetical protein
VLDAGDRLRCNSEQVLNALIQRGMGRVSFSLDSHIPHRDTHYLESPDLLILNSVVDPKRYMYGEGYGEFSGDNKGASPPPPGPARLFTGAKRRAGA